MSGPTLSRRALGRLLVKYRERAGLSQYAAAKIVETSQPTFGRLEEGVKADVPTLWVTALAERYNCTKSETEQLLNLTKEIRAASKADSRWWRPYSDAVPNNFNLYLELEKSARRLTSLQLIFLPGLFQIDDYRRAAIWALDPTLRVEVVEQHIELANARRARLHDPKFTVEVFLEEAVLRRQVGGTGTLARQLYHLVDVSHLPNVTMRLLPFSSHNLAALVTQSFVLLEFGRLKATKLVEPPVVYIEGFTRTLYEDSEDAVRKYKDAAEVIRRVAWSENDTRDLVLKLAREFE